MKKKWKKKYLGKKNKNIGRYDEIKIKVEKIRKQKK